MVATDVTGCREVALEGVSALTVPARDPLALADALARLAGDPALREHLGAGARRLVEAEFSETQVVRETLAPRGRIFVRGEIWNAKCEMTDMVIEPGTEVEVVAVDGMNLTVRPWAERTDSVKEVQL